MTHAGKWAKHECSHSKNLPKLSESASIVNYYLSWILVIEGHYHDVLTRGVARPSVMVGPVPQWAPV